MMRGLWKLTWLEFKIFMREPMGSVSTLVLPVALFVVIGRTLQNASTRTLEMDEWIGTSLPVLLVIIIALNGVISLATIMSIYREGGILKRLKATPLRPHTILTAHVLVKLALTAINVLSLLVAGRTFFSIDMPGSLIGFAVAVAISTISILALGFVIASVVPTARFAQIIAGAVLYPLVAISGIFVSVESLPPALRFVSNLSPLTHAVSLTSGAWQGDSWSGFGLELLALTASFIVCIAISSKVFRWE